MSKNKLFVGQKILLKGIGNNARHSTPIKETVITKIAKKYFYTDYNERIKFFIEELKDDRGDFMSEWKVYLSEQELLDEQEHFKLSQSISKYFSAYGKAGLPLNKLREIDKIINQ